MTLLSPVPPHLPEAVSPYLRLIMNTRMTDTKASHRQTENLLSRDDSSRTEAPPAAVLKDRPCPSGPAGLCSFLDPSVSPGPPPITGSSPITSVLPASLTLRGRDAEEAERMQWGELLGESNFSDQRSFPIPRGKKLKFISIQ